MNKCEQYCRTIKRMCTNGGDFSPFDLDAVWADMQKTYDANKTNIQAETYTTFDITLSSYDGSHSVVAPNKKIYLIPYTGSAITVIDTDNNDNVYNFGNLSGGDKYLSGTLAPNGCIYCAPFSASTILKIDPSNDTYTTFGELSGSSKWKGGAITQDGIMYCVPHSAGTILKINTNNDTYSKISSSLLSGTNAYTDAVLARNGCIYIIPRQADNIIKINPADDSITKIGTVSGQYKYLYGQLGIDGNIYALDSDSSLYTLKIDTSTDTVTTLNVTKGGSNGVVLGQNGYIYGVRYTASVQTNTRRLDVFNESVTFINTGTATYSALKLAPNGFLYAIPSSTGKVSKIDLHCEHLFNISTVLSPYINR